MIRVTIIFLLGLLAFHLIHVYQRVDECSRLFQLGNPTAQDYAKRVQCLSYDLRSP